jgi:hypothetical protein
LEQDVRHILLHIYYISLLLCFQNISEIQPFAVCIFIIFCCDQLYNCKYLIMRVWFLVWSHFVCSLGVKVARAATGWKRS